MRRASTRRRSPWLPADSACNRYADYVAALNGNIEPYEGYLQAFRYGMPPHGGFALGLERWTPRVVGAVNVRETALFPRDRHCLVT